MDKYTKKPITIQALQFDRANPKKALNECPKLYYTIPGKKEGSTERRYSESKINPVPPDAPFYIDTLEGQMEVSDGDWIIMGIKGEFYPIKPDIFEQTYNKFVEASADLIDNAKQTNEPPTPVEPIITTSQYS